MNRVFENRQNSLENTSSEDKPKGHTSVHCIFTIFKPMISEVGHVSFQLKWSSLFLNLLHMNFKDVLFVQSWLFMIIYNNETMTRSLQHMGPLNLKEVS